jgi:hypothetical protein
MRWDHILPFSTRGNIMLWSSVWIFLFFWKLTISPQARHGREIEQAQEKPHQTSHRFILTPADFPNSTPFESSIFPSAMVGMQPSLYCQRWTPPWKRVYQIENQCVTPHACALPRFLISENIDTYIVLGMHQPGSKYLNKTRRYNHLSQNHKSSDYPERNKWIKSLTKGSGRLLHQEFEIPDSESLASSPSREFLNFAGPIPYLMESGVLPGLFFIKPETERARGCVRDKSSRGK